MRRRPNILVIQSDDHGQWASRPYGNSELRTAALCELGRTGVRLDRAFTPCPVCSPARASFWTGRIPSAHGIHDYLLEEKAVDHPGLTGQVTLAQQLQRAGYRTGLAGKWHCHHSQAHQPGFDSWFGKWDHTTGPHFGRQTFSRNGEIVHYHGYQAPIITSAAVEFLRGGEADQPFFLYVSYTNTHSPFAHQPPRLIHSFRDATFADIPTESPAASHGGGRSAGFCVPADPAVQREYLAQYYAAVEMIDEQVGRLLDELQGRGVLDDTLIVYTSDHGHMNGHHGLYTKGNATIPQNFLEESILVPCLISWPAGDVRAGAAISQPTDHCDLFATLLEAAGAPAPADGVARPGISFLPLLRGEEMSWRNWQVCEYGNARMIRTDQHKLIRRYPGPHGRYPDEFYDLDHDPRERENRIDDPRFAAVIEAMSGQLDDYFNRYAIEAQSGLRSGQLPWHNPYEPWRLTRP